MKSTLHFLLMFVCLAAAAFAQFDRAEVLGTIRDASGGALRDVTVGLTNPETGIEARTRTDENGSYTFFNVKSGSYTITAETPGFRKFTTTEVLVNVNARQRVDISMEVGVVTDTVTVTGAASILQTDTSEHGQVVN